MGSRQAAASPAKREPLGRYAAKRNFARTPEPRHDAEPATHGDRFVIQKHWASRLHYDFRLEHGGVLWSWAVPKGPSFDPKAKRMAIHVEDHPVSYGGFEGTIPPKQYGAGRVIVWDDGRWEPVGDPAAGMAEGKIVFRLHGQKLAGLWELVRIAKPGDKQDAWILFKKRDAWARPEAEYDVLAALPDSVIEHPLGLAEQREPREQAAPADAAPDFSRAKKAALPARLEPQLATSASAAPSGDWIVETKFDGYRMLARVERGEARLFTRNGHDWTSKLEPVARALEKLPMKSGWLDGELVVLDERGLPSFNRLQNALDARRNKDIVYFLFDLPFVDGQDLRAVPLRSRRARLAGLLGDAQDPLRFSADFQATPARMLAAVCEMGLEGVMAKRADAPYASGRSEAWLKLKCRLRQEFVVVGFTDRANAKGEVGALMLGYYEGGQLRHAGSVGTGWDHKAGADLHQRLSKLETKTSPVGADAPKPGRWSKRAAGSERWVKPQLVVEVAFSDWTPEGHVRHAVYQGLRADKPADAVRREPGAAAVAVPAASPLPIKITHPERVIDQSTGLTKLDLVRYYDSVADWLLPHLKDRPVSLVRAPEGIAGQLFFQKHPETRMPGLKTLDPALWPEHAALLGVHNREALLSAAQMNVIEFHTWNSKVQKIDLPDRVIFDLDPGEGVKWPHVQEAAMLVRTLLTELGLAAWLKTSGGKGLHVVVPLAPKLDYDTVKDVSQAIVQHLARNVPQRFVAKSGAANRVGKIFVDYLRNGHSQTTAAAYSARARPGLGVSMPLEWDELAALKSSSQWTIANAREHLSFQKRDPWDGYGRSRQTLARAMKLLGIGVA